MSNELDSSSNVELFFVIDEACYPVTRMQRKCMKFIDEMLVLENYH